MKPDILKALKRYKEAEKQEQLLQTYYWIGLAFLVAFVTWMFLI